MTFAHLEAALAEVDELGRRFEQAGHRLYLVGGIVRDQWLDEPLDRSSDIDLTTAARPTEIKAIVAPVADVIWTQGERFGTIGMRMADRAFEITTHRAESYEGESRKPEVTFGDDIEVDLSRRDFTVNSMAIEVPSGRLIDPWGGVDDLASGLLRTPLSADISFSDDPLRMLRAARFSSKYSLRPVDDVKASALALSERIRIVAIERIGDEIQRLLSLDAPAPGLRFLAETGLLAEVLCYGETDRLEVVQARLDLGIEICERIDGGWKQRLAGLLVGVFETGTEVQAATLRLRLSRDDRRSIVSTVASGLAVVDSLSTEASALRRWSAETVDHEAAIALARALAPRPVEHVEAFVQASVELVANEAPVPTIDGQDIMVLLDVDAGPVVGEAILFLRERYFELGPMSQGAQEDLLRTWWTERQRGTRQD